MQTELFYKIIDKVIIVKFKGEVNCVNRDDFEDVLNKNIIGFETVIIDFSEVTYISSTSIGFVINLKKRNNFNVIAIIPHNSFTRGLFIILRLDQVIKVYESLEKALNDLGVSYNEEDKSYRKQ